MRRSLCLLALVGCTSKSPPAANKQLTATARVVDGLVVVEVACEETMEVSYDDQRATCTPSKAAIVRARVADIGVGKHTLSVEAHDPHGRYSNVPVAVDIAPAAMSEWLTVDACARSGNGALASIKVSTGSTTLECPIERDFTIDVTITAAPGADITLGTRSFKGAVGLPAKLDLGEAALAWSPNDGGVTISSQTLAVPWKVGPGQGRIDVSVGYGAVAAYLTDLAEGKSPRPTFTGKSKGLLATSTGRVFAVDPKRNLGESRLLAIAKDRPARDLGTCTYVDKHGTSTTHNLAAHDAEVTIYDTTTWRPLRTKTFAAEGCQESLLTFGSDNASVLESHANWTQVMQWLASQ